jgi:hypothetical protein
VIPTQREAFLEVLRLSLAIEDEEGDLEPL